MPATALPGTATLTAKPDCRDYSKEFQGEKKKFDGSDKSCWYHLAWAMKDGLKKHPDWYPNGTTSHVSDVQCALYLKNIGAADGESHGCALPPCSAITRSMMLGADVATKQGNVTKCLLAQTTTTTTTASTTPIARSEIITEEVVTTTTTEAPPSVEWWGWLLIVLAIVGLIGAIAAFFIMGKKKAPPKKKRAVPAPPPPAPAPEPPAVATTSVVMPVAQPVYAAPVLTAPPVYVASPQVVTAPSPVYAAREVVTAPPLYAAPTVTTTAAPMYAAAPQMLLAADLNHDGVIESNEVFSIAQPFTYSAAQPVTYAAGAPMVTTTYGQPIM